MTVLLVLWQLGLEIGSFCDTSFFLKSSRFSGYPNHVLGFSGWPAIPVQFHNAFKNSPDYTVSTCHRTKLDFILTTLSFRLFSCLEHFILKPIHKPNRKLKKKFTVFPLSCKIEISKLPSVTNKIRVLGLYVVKPWLYHYHTLNYRWKKYFQIILVSYGP